MKQDVERQLRLRFERLSRLGVWLISHATVCGLSVLLFTQLAHAARFYVRPAIADGGVAVEATRAITAYVKKAVQAHTGQTLSPSPAKADFILQPRILRIGEVYMLTVEKIRDGEILYAAQTKLAQIEDLDVASEQSTLLAMAAASNDSLNDLEIGSGPRPRSAVAASDASSDQEANSSAPYADSGSVAGSQWSAKLRNRKDVPMSDTSGDQTTSNANAYGASEALPDGAFPIRAPAQADTSTDPNLRTGDAAVKPAPVKAPVVAEIPTSTELAKQMPDRKLSYWTLGLGPAISSKLQSDRVMYGLTGGKVWDISPQVSIKLVGDADFSSGADGGQFFNGSVGGNFYFLNRLDSAPFITASMGYGYAKSDDAGKAEGFSLGAGAGYQFFRTTEMTLELLAHVTAILNSTSRGGSSPSVFAGRIAINF